VISTTYKYLELRPFLVLIESPMCTKRLGSFDQVEQELVILPLFQIT
jgi:hypothetical protein